jgi:DNA-binding NarL/FixJ family response regulator
MRRTGLTPHQDDVLALLLLGKTKPEIAAVLGIAPVTVDSHIARISRTLMGDNRGVGRKVTADLLRLAVREGWLVARPDRTLRVTFSWGEELAHAA